MHAVNPALSHLILILLLNFIPHHLRGWEWGESSDFRVTWPGIKLQLCHFLTVVAQLFSSSISASTKSWHGTRHMAWRCCKSQQRLGPWSTQNRAWDTISTQAPWAFPMPSLFQGSASTCFGGMMAHSQPHSSILCHPWWQCQTPSSPEPHLLTVTAFAPLTTLPSLPPLPHISAPRDPLLRDPFSPSPTSVSSYCYLNIRMNDGTSKHQINDCSLQCQRELGRQYGWTKPASLTVKETVKPNNGIGSARTGGECGKPDWMPLPGR